MFDALRRPRLPLRTVLQAWWRGDQPFQVPANDPAPPPPAAVETPPEDAATADEWSPERIKVVEDMWGRGETTPLSAESTIVLLNWAGVEEGHQFLDLRAGLGSVLKLAGRTFNIQVAGLEPLEGLAEEANRRWSRGRESARDSTRRSWASLDHFPASAAPSRASS